MKLLEFIFQDFWHWLGSLFLLGVVFYGVAETIIAFRTKRIEVKGCDEAENEEDS